MLRSIFKLGQKLPYSTPNTRLLFANSIKASPVINYKNLCRLPLQPFSDGKKPLKGFEKFQRRNKKKSPIVEPEEEDKGKEEKKAQEIEPEEEPVKARETEQKQEKNAEKKDKEFEKEKQNKEKREAKEEEEEERIEEEKPKNKKKSNDEDYEFSFSSKKKDPGNQKPDGKYTFKLTFTHIALIAAGAIIIYSFYREFSFAQNEISYVDFLKNYLDQDKVTKITVKRESTKSSFKTVAEISTFLDGEKNLKIGDLDHFLQDLEAHQIRRGKSYDKFIPVTFEYNADNSKGAEKILELVWLGVLISVLFYFAKEFRSTMSNINKGMGGGSDIFGAGKSQVKIFGIDNQIKTRFKDVAGQDEAKAEITEFVEFLKKPKRFKELGAKIPRGALLTGPPGTGKTLLAKATAGEAGVPFLSMSGSDFVEMFVGVGASRVRDLFKKAKEHAPSIIFIDEIDAVGRKRESKLGGNDERDNTLNQLLVEMDGFGTEANVIVLAATNRRELLDPALTRPGRFDRSIEVTLPDIEGRKQIFMVHLKPIKLDPEKTQEEYAKRLATLTPGFSGAEIANLCNEAAIIAARKNKKFVSSDDFETATERIIGGLEKKGLVSAEEKKTVAVHESGHAVVSWFLEGGAPLLKLTIIPRSKGSLGFAQYLPNESTLETKEELLDRICCVLGGRCAEELFNTKVTTGAYDDLRKAYDIAEAMITKFGMSEKIGFIGFAEKDYGKSYSEITAKEIDDEIKKIIEECTERARVLVRKHKDDIEKLYTALLEKETLDLEAIIEVLGERPFAPKSNFKAYLEQKAAQNQEIKAMKEKLEKEKKEGNEEKETASNDEDDEGKGEKKEKEEEKKEAGGGKPQDKKEGVTDEGPPKKAQSTKDSHIDF